MLRNILRVQSWTRFNVTGRQVRCMAGHSKWANIKHIKAQKDGQRAVLFTKISRQIRLAIQEGGSADQALNSQLRTVVELALKKNMPSSSITSIINKSKNDKIQLKKYRLDIRYRKTVYIICTLYTDNFAGLKMNASQMVKKAGGAFVDVGHMFEDFGLVEARYDLSKLPIGQSLEEKVTADAIELGAEEVEVVDTQNGIVNFICSPISISSLSKNLESNGYCIENSEHVFSPISLVQLSSEEQKAYDAFIEKLRNLPGAEDIYDNVE